ncbi:hypothetical protein [Curtobacterium sp. MCJR17_043]|uniref:hypothetical protein n=1 Tax=Curtobacterium sp. MCJR17_043 TaxID=2175660 RepID=UPI0024DFCD2E|nr:hypothetical protein [Curtobacterium sp. MCJR17_043]WIB36333.1 hypothetical protein DEJ15_04020 [Curtobacterium sp. MCJR17_043]
MLRRTLLGLGSVLAVAVGTLWLGIADHLDLYINPPLRHLHPRARRRRRARVDRGARRGRPPRRPRARR